MQKYVLSPSLDPDAQEMCLRSKSKGEGLRGELKLLPKRKDYCHHNGYTIMFIMLLDDRYNRCNILKGASFLHRWEIQSFESEEEKKCIKRQ